MDGRDLGFRVCKLYSEPVIVNTPTPTPTPQIETIIVSLPDLPEKSKPLEMVLISSGAFMMGSPDDELDRQTNEGPQHQVTITKPFYIGKYEVTQAQWQAVMKIKPATGYGEGPNYPVYNLSWEDCQQFISKLNDLGQGTFRLPTEAEWEYACRAETTSRFYWGDDTHLWHARDFAWGYSLNKVTKEVELKIQNKWGLFDMSGNVWEWCQDWSGDYIPDEVIDPVGPRSGTFHVLRGGGWNEGFDSCRSAYRRYYGEQKHRTYGFRVVRNI